MKRKDNDMARRARVRAVVAYPAFLIALVVSAVLALTSLAPSAYAASPSPTETTTASPTPSSTADPTPSPAPSTTTTAAPSATPGSVPGTAPGSVPSAAPSADPGASQTPSADPGVVPGSVTTPGSARADHHVLAHVEDSTLQARYLPVDAPMPDASQFQTVRARFTMHNAGTSPITVAPQLEYRPDGSSKYTVVPELALKGIPLHMVREWVPSAGGGTKQGPPGADIPVAKFLTGTSGGGLAMTGHRSMAANPDRPTTLPTDSFTEQEFTVRLSMDAEYLSGYELRITNGTSQLSGTQTAAIHLGPAPAKRLSPGQHKGISVVGPAAAKTASPPRGSASSSAASAFPAALSSQASAIPAELSSSVPAAPAAIVAIVASTDIHGPYSSTSQQCATCHRSHTAKGPGLLAASSQSTMCLSCHDGTGASPTVQAQYSLVRPANNPATREFYSHDATAPSAHTLSELDEFGGVSNRHSECSDCHNPHKAAGTDTTQTTTGWEPSGRLAGASGVSVVNGAAGTAPTYTFLDGVEQTPTREYQLCFKCHSGSTALTSNTGLKPSQYALDKGVEFNPGNPSFHPVEAAGTNQTSKMADSLAGTSPYKLWNFTPGSTIRCLNCHASSSTPAAGTTPATAAGEALAPHTSANRGILLRNYQDRVLKSAGAAYSAGDFALCYVCHAEEPFVNETANATNFSLHGKHVSDLAAEGSGSTDIDTPGAGQGNAICAECHFRLHSTTNKVGTQAIPGTRLVNFAPNVQPAGGTISWTPTITGSGSCTLTCHGYEHTDRGY